MRNWIMAAGLFFSGAALAADTDGDGYDQVDDCDDTNPLVNPGQEEVCDGIDNNCNDEIDEGVGVTYWADTDEDGYGDPDHTIEACNEMPGFALNNQDCDDDDASINPVAEEVCDGVDNNCNNEIDEGCDGEPSAEPGAEPSGEPGSEPSEEPSSDPASEPGSSSNDSEDDEDDRYTGPSVTGRPDTLDSGSGCGGGKSLFLLLPLTFGMRRRRTARNLAARESVVSPTWRATRFTRRRTSRPAKAACSRQTMTRSRRHAGCCAATGRPRSISIRSSASTTA